MIKYKKGVMVYKNMPKEIFREDTQLTKNLILKSREVMIASRKLHLTICGGMPGSRPRKTIIIENINNLKEKIFMLESQLENEKLNSSEMGDLTFF